MAWLNINDSLSNLKGQLSNFANNVLADEDEGVKASKDLEEYQHICIKQNEEIQQLRKLNEELQKNNGIIRNENEENNWSNWEESENKETQNTRVSDENSSDARKLVSQLQSEKEELVQQLDQIDADHQQTISGFVAIKNNLQDENSSLKEALDKLRSQNALLLCNEEKLKEELKQNKSKSKDENLLKENLQMKMQLEEAQKELSVLLSTNSTLQKVLEDTKKANEDKVLEMKAYLVKVEKQLDEYRSTLEESHRKTAEEDENYKKLEFILESYEQQVRNLKQELALAHKEIEKLPKSTQGTEDKLEIEQLKAEFQTEKEELHKKYTQIFLDHVKKYIDYPQNENNFEEEEDLQEFSIHVQNILKILLDFKIKCEGVANEVYDLKQERTKILEEKNHEIEKLIQNSELLSSEVISKTQTIKEYENECGELMKNNDLLINELEAYKNNSGLQTISETNEDNMLLLETQLEKSNKRVEDLEKIVDELEGFKDKLEAANKQIEDLQTDLSNLQESKQLETTIEKLSIKENEVNNKEKDYQELLNAYDKSQIEIESLKRDVKNLNEDLQFANLEKEELKNILEKMKSENENAVYQLDELNTTTESLKEEIECLHKENISLSEEHSSLQVRCSEVESSNKMLRSDLQDKLLNVENQRNQLELQIRTLTEKLQNCKMNETSLKLHNDTLNKELLAVKESKSAMELVLNESNKYLEEYESNFAALQQENDDVKESCEKLENLNLERKAEIQRLEELTRELNCKIEQFENIAVDEKHEHESIEDLTKLNQTLLETEEQKNLQTENEEKITMLLKQIEELNASRNELINMVTTKHNESLTYHSEIQRLSKILNDESEKCRNYELKVQELSGLQVEQERKNNEELEKLIDQVAFLRQKCEVLAENLLQEQSNVQKILSERPSASEKEQALSKKLERLQTHLIEVEEHYTQELLQAEQKNSELQVKVNAIEEREKNSSTMYTSVSIRANQQVEVLQNQLQLLTNQREELRRRISDSEDSNNKQAAALANLQFVLETFQKDKERDIRVETERIRRQIVTEKQVQEHLKSEIGSLKMQLEDSKQGLQAASRLSDQLEQSKKMVAALKEEVTLLQGKLSKSEEHLKNISEETDIKVDKSLIKNLVLGFVTSNNNMSKDQTQILKIIATVLDFNQQDHDKINLNKSHQGSWLGSLLAPQSGQNMTEESLSQAFVKFLENESKPRVVPSLLENSSLEYPTADNKSDSTSTPRQSPLVLSEIVLPTFADFAQNRNSSSILKDVLKDNSNS